MNPNIIDNEGYAAIHYAVLSGNIDFAIKLIEKCKVDAKNKDINGFLFTIVILINSL